MPDRRLRELRRLSRQACRSRAKMLVDRGAEAVALASCIGKGSPIGFPCPNREQMVQAIRAKIGDIPLLEYTH